MTFVTKLRFRSGNRESLEAVVGDLKRLLGRKGADCKGPHSDPPTDHRVPQYRTLTGEGGEFDPWRYTVYSRRMEIHGSAHIAREVGHMEFPDDVRVEIEVERRRPVGSN
ncbi:MAG: 30S ribosomal protein S10 [Haloferacaceae archaeon]